MTKNSFLQNVSKEVLQEILEQEKTALYLQEGVIPEDLKCQVCPCCSG